MSVFDSRLPILLPGLATHIVSVLAWAVLPHHKPEWKKRPVQIPMGLALMGMRGRYARLNAAALDVAKTIGPIEFSDASNFKPLDVVKHLSTDRLEKEPGVQCPEPLLRYRAARQLGSRSSSKR